MQDHPADYGLVVESLYLRFADDVLRVSYFYLGDRGQAEDVTQDVFMRLMRQQPQLKEGSEKSWLLKVALNLCRDMWRSAWVKRVILGSRKLELIPAESEIEDKLEKEAVLRHVPRAAGPGAGGVPAVLLPGHDHRGHRGDPGRAAWHRGQPTVPGKREA